MGKLRHGRNTSKGTSHCCQQQPRANLMKVQPSDPRKASRLGSFLHQSGVLCRILLLSRCQQTFNFTVSVHRGWAPHFTHHGTVLRLVLPLGVTSDPGLAPELPRGTVSSLHAPVPITGNTPGISGHAGVTVTVVLVTQCGVSSWLWSDGVRAGGWWLQGPQRSIFPSPSISRWDGMQWDRTGWTSPPCLSSPQCPPHLPPKPQLPAPGC